jgi:poly-gamma-glutamate synthesis protein (capsule biosynthesis protein)
VLIAVLVVLVVGAGVWFWQNAHKSNNNAAVNTAPIIKNEAAKPTPKSVEGKYLFAGTIVLARAVERYAMVGGKYDYNQPFSQLDSFEPSKYDGWMTDFECPITTNDVPYQRQIDNLIFNCRPEWLPAMTKYFKFFDLANNHTGDMGVEGIAETKKHLNDAGVQHVGNYRPSVLEDVCEVMGLPVRIKMSDNKEVKSTLPWAFCAYHYFSFQPGPGEIEQISKYAEVMPVFSFMEAGLEYQEKAGANQVDFAHRMIDAGAEFVIGNNPHWVQNSEAYKGKLIVYSTGNFIFDQLDFETQRSVSMDTTFEIDYDDNLAKWLAMGESCKVDGDDCLEKAKQQGLTKPKIRIKYEPVAGSNGVRKITKKEQSLQAGIEQRLDWATVSRALSQ